MVNLYQLYFSSSHFLSQPNKKVFHLSTFPPFQPNTNERKLNLFYPPTFPLLHPNRALENKLVADRLSQKQYRLNIPIDAFLQYISITFQESECHL